MSAKLFLYLKNCNIIDKIMTYPQRVAELSRTESFLRTDIVVVIKFKRSKNLNSISTNKCIDRWKHCFN